MSPRVPHSSNRGKRVANDGIGLGSKLGPRPTPVSASPARTLGRTAGGMGGSPESVVAESAYRLQLTALSNGYVERVIGSIRRECLHHVIVFDERHLRRVLRDYVAYYHGSRTHLCLGKDAPEPRAIQHREAGVVVSEPVLGGLHHRYWRQAA